MQPTRIPYLSASPCLFKPSLARHLTATVAGRDSILDLNFVKFLLNFCCRRIGVESSACNNSFWKMFSFFKWRILLISGFHGFAELWNGFDPCWESTSYQMVLTSCWESTHLTVEIVCAFVDVARFRCHSNVFFSRFQWNGTSASATANAKRRRVADVKIPFTAQSSSTLTLAVHL